MNILIACSDVVMLGLLEQALGDLGATIDTVPNEREIVERSRTHDYDVIITMFASPFINGKELVMKIRKKSRPSARICLVSWTQHEQTVISLYENGINQYFTLPINLNKLTSRIRDNILRSNS